MAKVSIVNRNKRRVAMVKKYAAKRESLKKIINTSKEKSEVFEARLRLQDLPRDSSPTRLRNRCHLTGRSRGVYRKFELCRHELRKAILKGEVPGVIKASW